MTTQTPKIVAWSIEGDAMFADDALDDRYRRLLDRMRSAAGAEKAWFELDNALMAFCATDSQLLAIADEAVEVIAALLERAMVRRRVVDEALGLAAAG